MSRRSLVFAATAVLAIALTVPAFGGPSNPVADTFASAKKTAKKALKKANKANKAAKQAQKSANAAQQSADAAQQSADAAQATADQAVSDAAAAQATADSKFGSTAFNSEDSPSNSTDTKNIAAGCPSGFAVTGGGFILNGAGANDVTVTLSSQYLSGWIVTAQEIGAGTGDNWSVSATVNCIN